MPLNISDKAANRLAEELARRMQSSETAAVRHALRNELDRIDHPESGSPGAP